MRGRVVLTLRGRLVALYATLLALLFGVLATWIPARANRADRAQFEGRALELTRLAATSAEPALDFDDPVSGRVVLAHVEHARGAAYAVLQDDEGVGLVSWAQPLGPLPLGEKGGEATLYRDGLLHVRVPLLTRAGHRGALLAGFHLDELESRRRWVWGGVVAAFAVAFVAGLAATWLIGTFLVRPLRAIAAVARRIAGGELAAAGDLPHGRSDEAGTVARALSQMLQRLYDNQATIEALNAELEQRVAKRTGELASRVEELKQAQEQLIVADRRVSIGRLAAGVAHEINNPLAFISSNLQFISEQLPALLASTRSRVGEGEGPELGAELCEAVAESLQGAGRVNDIVKSLKAFARTDDDRRQPVSVRAALEAAIEMSRHELTHRAALDLDLSPTPLVDGNEVRLSQVFLNLLINAAQAIPDGAVGARIRVTLGTDGRGWAVAEVHDSGCGIPQENLSRIFDPFFTTKPVGVGTGLGLSVSQGIVIALGGTLSAESAEGKGTTFRVALPPAKSAGAPRSARDEPRDAERSARLLVVDDEPLVLNAVRRALGRRHEVAVATSGAEALALIRGGARFDHILCDVMMPQMTGIEFHAELLRLAPEQADTVTFISGGAFTAATRAYLEHRPGRWLEKPLDPEQLRRVIDATS